MKQIIIILAIVLGTTTYAQNNTGQEKYGNTLNLGAGIGYYGYSGLHMPFGTVNYEFDIAKNVTLAPFIGVYSYRHNYYWGNYNTPYRNYYYRTVVVPVGVKGTYYFDQLFHANPKWDFYGALSAGFAFRNSTWENGYNGDRRVTQTTSPLYLDAHIGTEYHINQKAGLFLDLSTGVSSFGLAVHF